ncbi:pyridoxal phosphate-dependent aminotransferase [Intestinibacter sp.]
MEYKIRKSISSQIKETYAIEGEEAFENIEIDCAEGINTVSFSDIAIEAFNSIDYTIMKDYPHSLSVKKSIIDFWRNYTNVNLNYDNIVLCDGSITALFLINKLFIENEDKVLGLAPQFPEYKMDVMMCGGTFKSYKLNPEYKYKFIAEEFIDLISSDLKLIYIDNPNNPTGQIIPLDKIEKILKVALDKNIVVIVDEAYGDYMETNNSAITLIPRYENLIVAKTFSKAYGLAGLRGGYIIQNENLTKAIKNINTPYEMTSVTRAVASKVINDYDFLVEMRETNKKMKNQLIKNYKNLSISENGDTVSIMMVTHKNKNIDLAKEFSKFKIGVVACDSFECLDKNSIRFRLPSPKYLPKLIEAFDIIDNLE